jgi:hypothetical protein
VKQSHGHGITFFIMRFAVASVAVVSLGVPVAAAEPRRKIAVEVVDIAGDAVYVQPGEAKGVGIGSRVEFKKRKYTVEAATAAYAVFRAAAGRVGLGERGSALVRRSGRRSTKTAAGIVRPTAPAVAWGQAAKPAESQSPKYVPLSASAEARRYRVRLLAGFGGNIPLGGGGSSIWRGSVRGMVHAEPLSDFPLALDADAAVQLYAAPDLANRSGDDSRPVLVARQLQASVGQETSFYAALGRMRYAASSVGMLDGARVSAPVGGGFRVGAFGGVVPRPLDARPALDASRFGVEATYDDFESELRPSLSLVGYGSFFEGELDERRLDLSARVYPGPVSFGGYGQVSAFDKDNPWNTPAVQLSAAGADAGFRKGIFHIGARGDFRRPERSKWLASFLPPSYLCVREPRPVTDPAGPSTCTGLSDGRYLLSADTGITLERAAFTIGATMSEAPAFGSFQHLAFAQARVNRIFEVLYAQTMFSVADGNIMDTVAASALVGANVLEDDLDVSVRYRFAINQWYSELTSGVDHMVGGTAWLRLSDELRLAVDADAMMGPHASALLLQSSLQWIPL